MARALGQGCLRRSSATIAHNDYPRDTQRISASWKFNYLTCLCFLQIDCSYLPPPKTRSPKEMERVLLWWAPVSRSFTVLSKGLNVFGFSPIKSVISIVLPGLEPRAWVQSSRSYTLHSIPCPKASSLPAMLAPPSCRAIDHPYQTLCRWPLSFIFWEGKAHGIFQCFQILLVENNK